MSKLYNEYLRKKKEDDKKSYLFKSGMFYIFIDDDANKISKITPLKITYLTNDIVKCGFPENSLDKYLEIFKNLGLDVVLVEKTNSKSNIDVSSKIIKKIKNINVDTLTPIKALTLITEFKELVNE